MLFLSKYYCLAAYVCMHVLITYYTRETQQHRRVVVVVALLAYYCLAKALLDNTTNHKNKQKRLFLAERNTVREREGLEVYR